MITIKKKYGRLTVLRKINKTFLEVICICGKVKQVRINDIKRGKTKSCGCSHKDVIKHGMARDGKISNEYRIYQSMKQRCNNKNDKNYHNYGGRGITVSKEWISFKDFYKDMGKKPSNKTLDRIDNNKGYSKENCRWATTKEQMQNTRKNIFITFKNKTMTISDWSRKTGIPNVTIWHRYKKQKLPVNLILKKNAKREFLPNSL